MVLYNLIASHDGLQLVGKLFHNRNVLIVLGETKNYLDVDKITQSQ